MEQNTANTRGTVAVAVTGAFRVIPPPGPVLRAAQRLTFSVLTPFGSAGQSVSRSDVSEPLWPRGLEPPSQAPLSVGFSRREDWSGLPFPPPRDLPDPGMNPASCTVGRFFII